jgi:hypothetical protein
LPNAVGRKIAKRFLNPLKEKHLSSKKWIAKKEGASMARVPIENAAGKGRQVAALDGGLTCGRTRTTL